MIRRLAIIGGGSAYVPGLVAALIDDAGSLDLDEIRLHDIDEQRLDVVARLCARMAEAASCRFKVSSDSDLVGAVEEADAVLNTSRPGGYECRRIDETLPLEFGIPGQETVGPGGFFFALRSVPAALRLAGVMQEHAPGALLLNYTNPTNIVTQSLVSRGYRNVIGLCDQSDEDMATLGRALSMDGRSCTFECNGLNHATWYTNISFGGVPVREPPELLDDPGGLDEEHLLRFSLSRELGHEHPGFWPNSYIPYYTAPERFVGFSGRHGPRTDAIVAELDSYYAHFGEEARRRIPSLRHHRGGSLFGDLAARVLLALAGDRLRRLVLNVPNQGVTRLFGSMTVVESGVDLSSGGLVLRPAPPLPEGSESLYRRLEEYQLATAEAAGGGDAIAALHALSANPLVPDRGTAQAMLRRAAAAYGDGIPMLQ